jgi:uncharacterized protein (DUF2236 family)
MPVYDFSKPIDEAALAGPDSVSWRVFRNPLSLFIGGISAVLMELAEPRVRTGVWDHTTFRTDPLKRMRRTGLAAMVTVYGARTGAEEMIAHVGRMHARISGVTPDGVPYRADDPELLRWVHSTALFGFLEAYHRFVVPVSTEDRDSFVGEGVIAASLYGVLDPPKTEADVWRIFRQMEPELESSEIISEFLAIISRLPLFPLQFRPLNGLLIRAAVEILPPGIREILGLEKGFKLSPVSDRLLRFLGTQIDHLQLDSSPSAQTCVRVGLPADYLRPRK